MGRIVSVAAVIVVLTASWVCAGGFQVLADAAAVQPLTPLHIQPVAGQKAELKSTMKTAADVELESYVAPAAASGVQVKPRPAVAFRERSAAAMAPPPRMGHDVDATLSHVAEARDDGSSLESDLEKDLVLSPPPSKTEDAVEVSPRPKVEKRAVEPKPVVSGEKAEKKAAPQVKKMLPPDYVHYANSGKPIRKVKPVTQNQWNTPAGSYDNKPMRAERTVKPRNNRLAATDQRNAVCAPYGSEFQGSHAEYMNSHPRRAIVPPPTADRFVRDGVTIKLAPAAAAGGSPYPDEYRDDPGSDLLSAATEIIGLPFAFISSLF